MARADGGGGIEILSLMLRVICLQNLTKLSVSYDHEKQQNRGL